MHLVCPACASTNRIPDVRLKDSPVCGPCKTMAPHFAAAARQMPEVRFVKVDSDAAPASGALHGSTRVGAPLDEQGQASVCEFLESASR